MNKRGTPEATFPENIGDILSVKVFNHRPSLPSTQGNHPPRAPSTFRDTGHPLACSTPQVWEGAGITGDAPPGCRLLKNLPLWVYVTLEPRCLGSKGTYPQPSPIQSHRSVARLNRGYRGTSLTRNTPLLGPYSRTMPNALWRSWGGGALSYERSTHICALRAQISGLLRQFSKLTTVGVCP